VREGELSFDQVRSFLETIHEESRRVVRLAESLIDLNRFDPGQFRHARVRFALAEVVEDALGTLRPLAESGKVALKMQNAVADTGMEADRHQVKQLVLHLGRNALRFTPPGGSVTLRLSGDARDLMLEVEDTGIGIPEPQLETLFERFQPGPGARDGANSGLGLALCRSIVEWHGGHIYADSTPGMGSRFTVVLPRRCGPRVALRSTSTIANATDEALRLAIEMVAEVMNARVVTLYAPDEDGGLALRAATGLDEEMVRKISLAKGKGVAGWVAEQRRPACVSGPDVVPDGARGSRTGTYLCVPLLAGTELLGVLAVTDPASNAPFGAEDCHLLLQLAARVTHAWEESRALERSQQSVEDTTRTLRLVLDHLERGRRVAPDRVPLARALAQALDLSEAEIGLIGYAASIHDMGMSRMNERVLEGANPLTSEDRVSLERHPELGLEMLRPLDRLGAAREIVLGHHEWWDGSGYPRGLAGDRIPVGARILAVVDAWESMTVGRPHRTALSTEAALAELRARRGVQFDPAVVDVFEGVWREIDRERGKNAPANRETAPSDARG
jgi:putative methionine-R-sulfoxide reductase with GAF domain